MLTIFLLPLVSVTAATPTRTFATGTHDQIEHALNEGVHAAVEHGWAVANLHSESETEFVVTLVKGDLAERHVATFDATNSYRVERLVAVPNDLEAPSDFTLRALSSPRGAIELTSDCGYYYERPYMIDATATGVAARSLVGRALSTATDLESVSVDSEHAMFALTSGGQRKDLIVALDDTGHVISAELRQFEESGDSVTYKRARAMRKTLKQASVISIMEGGNGIVLKTAKGSFAVDPNGDAFESELDDGEYENCGC